MSDALRREKEEKGQEVAPRRRFVWVSAITGKFVSRDYAGKHPDTTFRRAIDMPPDTGLQS